MLGLLVLVVGVVEPHSGIQFEVPPELRCTYLPPGVLADGCGPIAPEQLSSLKTQGVFLFAVNPDDGAVLMGKSIPAAGAATMSEMDLDAFPTGVARGMHDLGSFEPVAKNGHVHQLEQHGGLSVATFELNATLETRAKHPRQAWVSGAVIPAGQELISVMETATEPNEAMRSVVLSLKAPAGYRGDPLFGTGQAHRMGYFLGQAMGGCFCLGAVLIGLLRLLKGKPKS